MSIKPQKGSGRTTFLAEREQAERARALIPYIESKRNFKHTRVSASLVLRLALDIGLDQLTLEEEIA